MKYLLSRIASLINRNFHQNIRIQGWARRIEKRKAFSFVHVNDGSTDNSLQVILPNQICKDFNVGSALDICGELVPSKGEHQNLELHATQCNLISASELNLNKNSSLETLRTMPHVRAKSSIFSSILRLRSLLNANCRQFFENEGFIDVDVPLLTRNDCEGAGEAFIARSQNEMNFFGENNVFLPVSCQLHLEALSSSLSKVYTIGAAFRAEKSLTRQHLAEFRMLEAEYAFENDLNNLCDFVEKFLKSVVENFRNSHSADMMILEKSSFINWKESLISSFNSSVKIPRLTHLEAIDILKSKSNIIGERLSKQNELELIKYCNSPVFITHFPTIQKPFYMSRSKKEEFALCFDLLTPLIGELAGGSLREVDNLRLKSRGCDESLSWYMKIRQYGHPPTAGFGIGMERFMQSLFGISNIKDTLAFPRWYKHCSC